MSGERRRLSLGIIGTGRIAQRFADMVRRTELAELSCVYNPHRESALAFAEKNGIDRGTDEQEELLRRTECVYIASPHQTHTEYAEMLLRAGRHVLCEKPMSFSEEDARKLYRLAEEKGCVLREAMKTAYCPGFAAMMQVAESGRIGTICDVEACFSKLLPTNTREYTDCRYGGSFTELGSYVLLPIFRLLGTDYRELTFRSLYAENGTDSYTTALLTYDNAMATVKTGLGVKTEGQLVISGTKGYILAPSPWWLTKRFEVRYEDPHRIEVYEYPYEGSGLQYELEAFVREINSEAEENFPGMSAKESIAAAGVMAQYLERTRERREAAERRQERKPKIWAHRGCSMRYPENTMEAFLAAAELEGLTGIELDVQFTKDRELVVFHDEKVARVTNGTGQVCEYTLQELKQLEIRSVGGAVARIPTLAEVLQQLSPYCRSRGLLINVELKTSVIRYEGIEEAVLALVRQYGLEQYVIYSSFLPESVARMKELAPDAQTGMLGGNLADTIGYARQTHADALHPGNMGLACRIPDDLKSMPVRIWNTEEPFFQDGRILKETRLTKYAAFGATDIFTNVPERYL